MLPKPQVCSGGGLAQHLPVGLGQASYLLILCHAFQSPGLTSVQGTQSEPRACENERPAQAQGGALGGPVESGSWYSRTAPGDA